MKHLLTGLVFAAFAIACTQKTEAFKIDPKEAFGMIRNDFAVLVDVRESSEIAEGMAAGAQWMPFTSKIEANHPEWEKWAQSLPKDKTIIVYCRSGRRSGLAAERLAAKGFRAANMGGYTDWIGAGLPAKKPESAAP
ncbi:MAG: hypothetical protein A2X94_17230 [Bdellovibrionales bacterium GWB1_55_8]|nr:MAG: hypothetical protein A2X94_17230 [Bdellovibrionales bacterium GWB1_55_8]